MKRQDMIDKLIGHDISVILGNQSEQQLSEMLEYGVRGYNEWLDTEIEDTYKEIFE
jgi:biotin synthase-like enzyme